MVAGKEQTIDLPIYYVSIVEKSNGANDLGGIKAASRLVELALALYVKHEIATRAIFHGEKQVALSWI